MNLLSFLSVVIDHCKNIKSSFFPRHKASFSLQDRHEMFGGIWIDNEKKCNTNIFFNNYRFWLLNKIEILVLAKILMQGILPFQCRYDINDSVYIGNHSQKKWKHNSFFNIKYCFLSLKQLPRCKSWYVGTEILAGIGMDP